jgi:hypothetical protein
MGLGSGRKKFHPGSGSRGQKAPDPGSATLILKHKRFLRKTFIPDPDPRVKKAPDPESATLNLKY